MLEKIEKFQILLLGLVIAIGAIIASSMITSAISKDTIIVTGSYSQNVVSDSGILEFELRANMPTKAQSFELLKKQKPVVMKYLEEQGIKPEEIKVNAQHGYEIYKINDRGISTNQIASYNANQSFSIKSSDVQKIKQISTEITDLTAKGLDISVSEPSYFYSKLSDMKVQMLEEATKDAKQRASAMLKATHNRVGKIQSVRMGVFQITPVDSNDVSDMGISDTSSIEKKITSVANVTFRIK